MHLELPEHLHSTRDLLLRSLPAHPFEQAPAMPAGLADELMARFAPEAAPVTLVGRMSLTDKLRAFLATPGFGLAAAAVVLIGVAMPLISQPERRKETFRGGESTAIAGDAVSIVFVGTNSSLQSVVENSGNFEVSAFRSAPDLAGAMAVGGAKVVVDFSTRKISALDSEGREIHSAKIPGEAEKVAAAVADAVSHL